MKDEIYLNLENSFTDKLRELPLSVIHDLRRGFSQPRIGRRRQKYRMCDNCIHGTHFFTSHDCSCICQQIALTERLA